MPIFLNKAYLPSENNGDIIAIKIIKITLKGHNPFHSSIKARKNKKN